jgi:SAM-dependent methyltransferase
MKNKEFATREYWESRYENETQPFEWFKDFQALRHLFSTYSNDSKIIQLGCGNSLLSADLFNHGFKNITNVDYSQNVIDQMSAQYPLMHWACADIFKLDQFFSEQEFDLAIDKGTLDALLTVPHDPWNPPEELLSQIHSYVQQVLRVLKPGGCLMHITFAQPHFRKRFLMHAGFEVSVQTLGAEDAFEYYVYHCIKK